MSIEFIPHEYQKYAIDKIIEQPKYNLFLEMGLGKTVSTLSAINTLTWTPPTSLNRKFILHKTAQLSQPDVHVVDDVHQAEKVVQFYAE